MEIDAVVAIITLMASAGSHLDRLALAEMLRAATWKPDDWPADTVPQNWMHGGIWAAIYSEEGADFIEFVFRAIRPGEAGFSDAMEDEYVNEVGEAREIADSLISAISSRMSVESTAENLEEWVDFIEKWSWKVDGCFLTVGVVHTDEDVPILLMARVRQS